MKEYIEYEKERHVDPDMENILDITTCKPFPSFDDMKEVVDDYGEGVLHHRSKVFGIYTSDELEEQKIMRKEYLKKEGIKKPTEILIFTDSFSYSSTSFFIKDLQDVGGAITVGYKGNPKSDEVFDASHSPSCVGTFQNSQIQKNLKDAGFEIVGTTIYESFTYAYQDPKPTPRDYTINPVDERVNIFQDYDDSLYDQFIQEGKRILDQYNKGNKCNGKNLKLVLENEKCYNIEGKEHAHGGFKCDENTNTWSSECVPFYCDIDYYFDTLKQICVKDICTESEEEKSDEEKSDEDKSDKEEGEDEGDDGLSGGAIAGIIIAIIVVLVIIGIILYKFVYLKRKKVEDINAVSKDMMADETDF